MEAVGAFLTTRELRIFDQPAPETLGPDDVMLRVCAVGIGSTDREIGAFRYGVAPAGSDRLVLGHESLARVVEVGERVTSVTPGEFVVPIVRRPCSSPHCAPCRCGRQDFCVTGGYAERGIKSLDGFLRRYVVEEAQHLVRVPAALSGVGVLVEPLTIATKAAEQARALLARITWRPTRPRGLVLGAGPVGLLGAMAMIAHGLDTFVYSRESPTDECARLSESIGAVYISAAETSAKRLAERIGEVELIFEAAGVSKLAFEAFWALAPNSTCVLTGIPAIGHSAEFEIDRLMRSLVLRNQALVGAVNAGRQAYTSAVDLLTKFMALFPDAVRRLVGELHPLAHAPALLHKRAGIKDVVAP